MVTLRFFSLFARMLIALLAALFARWLLGLLMLLVASLLGMLAASNSSAMFVTGGLVPHNAEDFSHAFVDSAIVEYLENSVHNSRAVRLARALGKRLLSLTIRVCRAREHVDSSRVVVAACEHVGVGTLLAALRRPSYCAWL